jgi:cytoskeletal protein CcmA (bactofilin family)
MSCPDEMTWSIYVDGELAQAERHQVETHLVSCRDCRSQVVALQDEVAALTNAMVERVPAASTRQAAAARELSWSLPVAVAAVTAVLAILGLVVEMRLPGVLDLFTPRRLMGVYEMFFDSVFMLRDRLPEIFDATAFVGAMAAFSALGCAVLHALSRRFTNTSSLTLILLAMLTMPDGSSALDFRRDQDTHVGVDETVSETLVCTGKVVSVDGTVDGDLVVAAERFTLRGTVTGNLYVVGGDVDIDGAVEGTVIGAGERVNLGGRVDGSVTLAGDRLHIMDGAQIGRDVALFGEGVEVAGTAGRDVTFIGDWLEVRGDIKRDLHVVGAESVSLLGSARIGRDVRAHLWGSKDEITQASGSSVGGDVEIVQESIVREHYLAHYRHSSFYVMVLVAAAAAFLFGLVIFYLDPRLFASDLPDGRGFVRSLGIGFVLLLAGPVALGLVGFTVVGIPIAILGLFVLISALYTSFVLVAGLVGQTVLAPSGPGIGGFAPSLLVGVLIMCVVAALPFVGVAIRILAILFGLGCLFERARGVHALTSGRLRV